MIILIIYTIVIILWLLYKERKIKRHLNNLKVDVKRLKNPCEHYYEMLPFREGYKIKDYKIEKILSNSIGYPLNVIISKRTGRLKYYSMKTIREVKDDYIM